MGVLLSGLYYLHSEMCCMSNKKRENQIVCQSCSSFLFSSLMVAMLENYVCGVSFTKLLVLVALKLSDMLHLVHIQKCGTGLESFGNFS